MVMQLATKDGKQIKALLDASADFELNDGERDFELITSASDYDKELESGRRIFVPGTEIGGIIGEIAPNTKDDTITYKGYCWRGYLSKKIIVPPAGKDRYTVEGELNDVLRDLIEPKFDGVFRVPEVSTGVTIKYEFDRFCTLLDGLEKMLKTVNYRLEITYNQGEPNGSGWVDVQALPIVDYSDEIELSQDSRLNFNITDKRNGVNHLVVAGKGELQDRNVFHLFVQEDGSIGDAQVYFGIDEIAEVYKNTSTETSEIRKEAIEHLQEIMNKKTMEMDVESLGIDVAIGDIIGGRDYITGTYMAKPLKNIIVRIEGGTISKEYRLED